MGKLDIVRILSSGRGKFSRYVGDTYVLGGGGYCHSSKEIRHIEASADDMTYTVTSGFEDVRWVSLRFYNDMRLFWVIADLNKVDPNKDMEVGTILRIPTMDSLYSQGVFN